MHVFHDRQIKWLSNKENFPSLKYPYVWHMGKRRMRQNMLTNGKYDFQTKTLPSSCVHPHSTCRLIRPISSSTYVWHIRLFSVWRCSWVIKFQNLLTFLPLPLSGQRASQQHSNPSSYSYINPWEQSLQRFQLITLTNNHPWFCPTGNLLRMIHRRLPWALLNT